MPLFTYYVMVDWSAQNGRKSGKPDTIWIAHGARRSVAPTTESPASRTDAEAIVRKLLTAETEAHEGSVLVCFDFAYGYPAGFATPGSDPPWLRTWKRLAASIRDDIGTKNGRVPSNKSNRFQAADDSNAALSRAGGPVGPFWCAPSKGVFRHIPQNRPAQPFNSARGTQIGMLRQTDARASSDTPFRLFGTGSVGSQVLLGIPRIHALRFDKVLGARSKVWPFETGWADATEGWKARGAQILHAEIYPSVRPALGDDIKDRGQVRAMWHWARDLDMAESLQNAFRRPSGIVAGAAGEASILNEEGWILGCP